MVWLRHQRAARSTEDICHGRADAQRQGCNRAHRDCVDRQAECLWPNAKLVWQPIWTDAAVRKITGYHQRRPLWQRQDSVSSVAVERLLSISGEDTLIVDRKYKEPYTGKLPDRLQIISNELPRFGDASGAIIGRLVVLLTTRSWLGKEDFELENKLRTELPGILNWSLEGLRRLTFDNENHFNSLCGCRRSNRRICRHQSALSCASGVCSMPRPRLRSMISGTPIKHGARPPSIRKWTKPIFGRDLRAACPSVRKQRPREKDKAKAISCMRASGCARTRTSRRYEDLTRE